ncbi:MAG: FAD-dependent oxidoreductase, partial [Acidimicrobiia bacterium]|nr:FAD-dependent oxidoreductase [Acidimicrobiia bacterium]
MPADARVAAGPLPGETTTDVVIVGAGLTGLWTAYYLAAADPALRIVVVDAATIGFGASGRNGGWCSGFLPMSLSTMSDRHGRYGAVAMQRAMYDTVGEVGRILAAEGADAGFRHGGTLSLARTAAQEERLRADLAEARQFGFGEEDVRWLGAGAVASR